jgi:hypothetical protein
MGVRTLLTQLRNRIEGNTFEIWEEANGDITGKLGDQSLVGSKVNPLTGVIEISAGSGEYLRAFREIGGLIVNDPSAAAANSEIIASALAKRGPISLSPVGTVYVDRTAYPESNTLLVTGDRTHIKAVPGGPGGVATFPIFINKNANSTPVEIESITSAMVGTGIIAVTVAFKAAHGLTVGEHLQIKGDGNDVYNNIWKVDAVTDETHATFNIGLSSLGTGALPPSAALAVASASQTVATPGVFTTDAQNYAPGQPVKIVGTPPTGFSNNTIYYVIKTGLTSAACQLALSPFATAGIQVTVSSACSIVPYMIGAKADANITICGNGTIDGDYKSGGFTWTQTLTDHGMILRRALNCHVSGLSVVDFRKYGIMTQDTYNCSIKNIPFTNESDGIHNYGPCVNMVVEDISGHVGDDGVIFQNIDGAIYLPFMYGSGFDVGGDIINPTARRIRFRNGRTSSIAIYPNGNSGAAGATNQIYAMRGVVTLSDVNPHDPLIPLTGTTLWEGPNTVAVGSGYVTVAGSIETLHMTNAGFPIMDNLGGAVTISIGNLILDKPQNDVCRGGNLGSTIKNLAIKSFTVNQGRGNNVNGNVLYKIGAGASVTTFTFNQGYYTQTGSGTFKLLAGADGTLGEAIFNNVTCGANCGLIDENGASFTATPLIVINDYNGETGSSAAIIATGTQSYDVKVNGLKTLGAAFNFYSLTGTINLYISGMKATTIFQNLSGNVSMYNPDGTCPVSLAALTRNSGQIAKASINTGTGSATDILANNLCVCDSTNAAGSWKQLSAPTTRVF